MVTNATSGHTAKPPVKMATLRETFLALVLWEIFAGTQTFLSRNPGAI